MKIEEKYHEPILALIKEKGALGVSVIAPGIGMPVTSVHKYLLRQDYFKQNSNKKWDLPENVTDALVNSLENNRLALVAQSLKTQSLLLSEAFDTFSQGFTDILKQVDNIAPLLENHKPSVAKERAIHPRLLELDSKVQETHTVFKRFIDKVPEKYKDLIKNLDLHLITIEMGTKYMNGPFNEEIASLLLEQTTELSEELLNVLKEYQKGE